MLPPEEFQPQPHNGYHTEHPIDLDIIAVSDFAPAADPIRYSFSGHETFPLRYAWLPKGVQNLLMHPNLFTQDDAMVIMGVGKNMVQSIRHWCETLRLIETTQRGQPAGPTRLGLALFGPNGWDPYLEDPGTLWLLHWLLASRRDRASTWYLAFTQFNEPTFTREDLVTWLERRIQQVPNTRATATSLRRDVDVFLRTYVPSHATRDLTLEDTFDCPLVELGIIKSIERGRYQFVRGAKPSLPHEIFVYALLDFWQRTTAAQRTLSFETLLYGTGSPGGVFKLSENALVEQLEQLPRWSQLNYDETAGMRLILRHEAPETSDPFTVLEKYYGRAYREALL